MRMKPFDEREGYRVWLDDHEVEQLIETMDNRGGTMHRVASRLGVHCGLRREEASKVAAIDVTTSLDEPHLRVWEDTAKRDKYRETPIPQDLADQMQMIPEFRSEIDIDEPVLDVSARTLNRWVKRAGEELVAETKDEGWMHITFHDLRRTWGTRALEYGVLPSIVMEWGGWDSWATFRKFYLGEFSPHALKRERSKVGWLGGPIDVTDPDTHLTPVSNPGTTWAED